MDCRTHRRNSYKHQQRVRARHLAKRCSDNFCETYGDSALDSIAPFERDEIILGRRVGSGSFSSVYEIMAFNLRRNQLEVYSKEQVTKREAIAKSVKNGAKYVMKYLRDEVEEPDDEDLFLDAAQDIVHEAEMLAALSHPNIVNLHGIIASRHDAFLGGASAFFLIIERLESTLADTIEIWAKEKKSFNPPRSFKSLSSSSSRAVAIDKVTTSADKGGSLDNRLRAAASLAGAVEYLHSQGVIFRDLKPDNVGFDEQGIVKLFDFGLSRFMPQYSNAYGEVYEMTGAGTPRYTPPEVIFNEPYNLKADVYSFSVILWELACLEQPFAKFKRRNEFYRAISRGETLGINRRWPQQIHDTIRHSISRDLAARPTMREVSRALNECVAKGVEDFDVESTSTPSSTRKQLSKSIVPARLSSTGVFFKFSPSWGSTTATTVDTLQDFLEELEQNITA